MQNFMRTVKILAVSYSVFIAMDFLWFGLLMSGVYKNYLGPILRMRGNVFSPVIASALVVWALIVVGSYVLLLPRIEHASILAQFCWGAFYGLILYGVYNFTNHAVLNSYPLAIAVIDSLWGGFANGILAIILVFLYRFFTK